MKKIIFVSIAAVFYLTTSAQGIDFENMLSWEKIKKRALHENKYIFIDCYATWCLPCKKMDKEVFSLKDAGDAYNNRFISVKVQMDQTNGDSDEIQSWYKDAAEMANQYNIVAFPTQLFFSPDGKLIYRREGSTNIKGFIDLAEKAINSARDNRPIIEQYLQGKVAVNNYPEVEKKASAMGMRSLADQISEKYIRNYLNKLSDDKLLTAENYQYLDDYRHKALLTTSDKIFRLSLKQPKLIEEKVKVKEGRSIAYSVISRNLKSSLIKNEKAVTENPNWKKITVRIKRKYGPYYSGDLILYAKKDFYFRLKRWKEFADAVDELITMPVEINGYQYGGGALNNDAWFGIFEKTDDPMLLKRAIHWMDFVAFTSDKNDPNTDDYYDTRANLLYKSGQVESAINYEQELINRIVARTGKPAEESARGFLNTLNKMKRGEPTWFVPVSDDTNK